MDKRKQQSQRRTQAQRSEETRNLLIDTGRRLFGDRGYQATSLDEIVAAAQLTKGAVYHHFKNKLALFTAVTYQLEDEFLQQILQSDIRHENFFPKMIATFLDACVEQEFRQIVLLDSPAVLGLDRWYNRDIRLGNQFFQRFIRNSRLLVQDDIEVNILTNLIIGGLIEAAKLIAESDDPAVMRRKVGDVTDRLLPRLFAD